MSHRLPSLWYPEASYTKDAANREGGSEEGGRGSLPSSPMEELGNRETRLPIPRRRTPTVAVMQCTDAVSDKTKPKQGTSTLPQIVKRSGTYETVEKVDDLSLLDLSPLPYRTSKKDENSPVKKYPNWFCGWTDEEYFDLHRNTCTKAPKDTSRSGLQTPHNGIRTSLYTRASFSSAMRRRPPYKFQHFQSYEEYLEQYRTEYSYTSMFAPHQSNSEKDSKGQEAGYKIVSEEASTDFPIEIKNIYREDPYFAELVSRLGIKEPPKNLGSVVDGDHSLLRGLKPTPPSIVKKKKNVENIIISNSGKSCHGDNVEARPATSSGVHVQSSSRSPRPSHRQMSGRLPRITQATHISQYIQKIYNEHKSKKKLGTSSKVPVRRRPLLKATQHEDEVVEEEDDYKGMSDIDEREEDADEELDEMPDDNGLKGKRKGKPKEQKYHSKTSSTSTAQGTDVGPTSLNPGGMLEVVSKQSEPADSSKTATKAKVVSKSSQNVVTPWNCLDLDQKQREKVISDTAYLLGVGSRDWAKSYMRKLLSNDAATKSSGKKESGTRPPTRQQSRAGSRMGYANKTQCNHSNSSCNCLLPSPSRSRYRNSAQNSQDSATPQSACNTKRSECGMEHGKQVHDRIPKTTECDTATSFPVCPMNRTRSESRGETRRQTHPFNQTKERFRTPSEIVVKTEKKIEELKSIYNSGHSRKTQARINCSQSNGQSSRHVSRLASRQDVRKTRPQAPPTSPENIVKEQNLSSRPTTQATGRKSRLLPIRRQRRSHNVRVQSNTSITSLDGSGLYWNEVPRPPTSTGRQRSDCTGVKVHGLAQVLPCKRSITNGFSQVASKSSSTNVRKEAIPEDIRSRSPSSCGTSLPSRLCQPKDILPHKQLAN